MEASSFEYEERGGLPLINGKSVSFEEKSASFEYKTEKGSLNNSEIGSLKDNFFVECASGIGRTVQKVIKVLGRISMDTCALSRLCRLGINTVAVIERCIGRPGLFTGFIKPFESTETVISTINGLDQVSYFGAKKYKEDSVLGTIGQAAFLTAGIGGALVLAAEFTVLCMAEMGEALGAFIAWGSVAVSGAVALGALLFAIDSAITLSQAKTKEEKTQAILDLAWNVAELALAVFILSGITCIPALIALGTVAAGLGLTSFIYNLHREDLEKEAAKTNKQIEEF